MEVHAEACCFGLLKSVGNDTTTTTITFSNSAGLLEHGERFPGGVSYSKEELGTSTVGFCVSGIVAYLAYLAYSKGLIVNCCWPGLTGYAVWFAALWWSLGKAVTKECMISFS